MKKLGIGIVIALVLLIGGKFLLNLRGQDDAKLIQEALTESIKASREGRPGGVMELLSQKIKVNDESPGSTRQIADFIKNSHPEISIKDSTPVVSQGAGTAQITSPAHLKMSLMGQSVDRDISSVTLTFQREDATEWLIFPTKKWRLTDVTVPPDVMAQGIMGG